jgi:hypothetical protein
MDTGIFDNPGKWTSKIRGFQMEDRGISRIPKSGHRIIENPEEWTVMKYGKLMTEHRRDLRWLRNLRLPRSRSLRRIRTR